MLNLWIGLCRGAPGLPRDLRDLGYDAGAIEHQFKTGAKHAVQPELIAASEQIEHAILLETKQGRNVVAEQLDRYASVTSQDLVQRAKQPPDACKNWDVTILGRERHEGDLVKGLQQSGHSFPFLVATGTGLALKANQFSDARVTAVFQPELEVDFELVPTFVPVDKESTDAEIAHVVLPLVLTYMKQRVPKISIALIAEGTCRLTWPVIGTAGQKDLRAAVKRVLQEAAKQEFWDWLSVTGDSLVVKKNPFGGPPVEDSRALKKYTSRLQQLVERLDGGQLSLFDQTI